MSNQKLENKKKINPEIEKELLLQGYSRYVSRAHTVFSTYFDIILAIIFGTLGIIIGLVEIGVLLWNKFYFLNVVFVDIFLILIVTFISAYTIYDSRKNRSEIVISLKCLGTG